jgi:4-amino-4-deoxy-L-arabinose transferase-like glycosyltransferase
MSCSEIISSFSLGSSDIAGIFTYLTCLLKQSVLPLLVALAVLGFVWGVIQYFIIGDEKKREKGKDFMLWGIIAIFVIVSIWGLVKILGDTVGVDVVVPQIEVK